MANDWKKPEGPKLREREDAPFSADQYADFDLKNDPHRRFIARKGARPQDAENGLTQFFGGAALFGLGTWMLFSRVMVTMGISGASMFGMGFGGGPHIAGTLIPFVLGIVVLFVQGSGKLGWGLVGAGILALIVQIITNLTIHFTPTSLPMLLFIVGMMASGVGLIARSLRGGKPVELGK